MKILIYTGYPNNYYLSSWALMCDLGQGNKGMFIE